MRYTGLPWLDEEDADLYKLAQVYGRDASLIAEKMRERGWDRSDSAIANRLQRAFPALGFSVPRRPVKFPDEIEMLARHRPWRKQNVSKPRTNQINR